METTYQDKLKDPRWQKKRLQIFERDDWACRDCGDSESTLNVHHLKYNGAPWDAKDEHLVTLCEKCHHIEHRMRKSSEDHLLNELRDQGFRALDLIWMAEGIHRMRFWYPTEVVAQSLARLFTNPTRLNRVIQRHFRRCRLVVRWINPKKRQN